VRTFLRALGVGLVAGALQAAARRQSDETNPQVARPNQQAASPQPTQSDADPCDNETDFEGRTACRQANLSGQSGWREGTSFDAPVYSP
jgi:hypothetical protein